MKKNVLILLSLASIVSILIVLRPGLSKEVNLEYQNKLEDGTIIVSSAAELAAGVDVSILTEDG